MAVRSEAREIMSLHEEKPPLPGEPAPEGEKPNSPEMPDIPSGEPSPNWGGAGTDPAAATEVAPYPPAKTYPEDLQISWSWPHLILLLVFGFGSLVIIQGVLAVMYMPRRRLSICSNWPNSRPRNEQPTTGLDSRSPSAGTPWW